MSREDRNIFFIIISLILVASILIGFLIPTFLDNPNNQYHNTTEIQTEYFQERIIAEIQ